VIDDNPPSQKHNGWHCCDLQPQGPRSRAFYYSRNSLLHTWITYYTELPMKVPITPHHLENRYYTPPPIAITGNHKTHPKRGHIWSAVWTGINWEFAFALEIPRLTTLGSLLSIDQLGLQNGKVRRGNLERILPLVTFLWIQVYLKGTHKSMGPNKAKYCKFFQKDGKPRPSCFWDLSFLQIFQRERPMKNDAMAD